MNACPQCANQSLKRSDARGFVEERILPLLKLAPFRCSSCGRRFYRYKSGKSVAEAPRPQGPAPPVTFLKAEDGITFQQLIENLRDAERKLGQ